jgi:hypothetical protein
MPPEDGLVATGDSDKTFNRTFQHFEGFTQKVARLWQVIRFSRDSITALRANQVSMALDLHPAGLEPATL